MFSQAIWQIWLHRNRFIYKTGRKEHNIHVQSIKRGAEFFALIPDYSNKLPRVQVQISWKKPLAGWMKLNTDGAVFGNPIQVRGGRCDTGQQW